MKDNILPVIANTRWISFGWYEYYLSELTKYAAQHKCKVSIVYHIDDLKQFADQKFVLVIGTDVKWIKSVFETLRALGLRGVVQNCDIMNPKDVAFELYTDQASIIQQSLCFFREQGRTRVALFGVKRDDTSDRTKVRSFLKEKTDANPEDIYYSNNNIEDCLKAFFNNISKYDAVICADDIVGVFLINACNKAGIKVPEDLYVVGNGNLRIGNYSKPALSTFMNQFTESGNHMEMLLNLFDLLCAYPEICSLHLSIDAIMLNRESTNMHSTKERFKLRYADYIDDFDEQMSDVVDPVIKELCIINHAICVSDETDLAIINRQLRGESHTKTAVELYLSVDTIKYRMRKIYKRFGVSGKNELLSLLRKNGIFFEQ